MRARHHSLSLCFAVLLTAFCRADASVVYVNQNAPGTHHNGQSWETAFLSVQDGVNAAQSGSDVWVAAGTYVENVTVSKTVLLYGGFAGTETLRGQRNPAANVTILDGNNRASVVKIDSTAPSTVIDGFTIRNGAGTAVFLYQMPIPGTRYYSIQGGGIYAMGRLSVISNNIIEDNNTDQPWSGSGLVYYGGPGGGICGGGVIVNNVIRNNAGGAGDPTIRGAGGISVSGDGSVVAGNLITGNTSRGEAGGLYVGATPGSTGITIHGNRICGNSAGYYGGGISLEQTGGSVELTDNLIADNTAGLPNSTSLGRGGGIALSTQGTVRMAGNTITGNTTLGTGDYVRGGGVCIRENSAGSITLVNNIVSFNNSGISVAGGSAPPTLRYNDVYGNALYNYGGVADATGQSGNIWKDPLFVSRASRDYHLLAGSPCIDAGDSTAVASGETDLDSLPRIRYARVDMGAYEFDSSRFTLVDAVKALRVAAGLNGADSPDLSRLDVEPSIPPALDLADALRLARKAAGQDNNP